MSGTPIAARFYEALKPYPDRSCADFLDHGQLRAQSKRRFFRIFYSIDPSKTNPTLKALLVRQYSSHSFRIGALTTASEARPYQ